MSDIMVADTEAHDARRILIRRIIFSLAVLTLFALFTTGCAWSSKAKGAVIGAGAGGAAGAVVGNATGSTVRGAIIGAAVGGTAGAVIGHQMDQQAKELEYALPGAQVQRMGEGIAVTFPDGLLFPFDSDQLHSHARENMRAFAASMAKYPNTRALVVGHTDSVGAADYNQALSERRAHSTADYIASNGVARSRITTVGSGQREPVATNETDDGRRENRRVEVAIFAQQ
jgi:outer membrane protein OmpA-like peptidoglycan-associated protein